MRRIIIREASQKRIKWSVLLALLFIIMMPACSPAPEKAKSFKTIFDHYRDKGDIVAISFPPGLVGIFLSDDDPEQAEIKQLMQELSAFRMLTVDSGSSGGEGSGQGSISDSGSGSDSDSDSGSESGSDTDSEVKENAGEVSLSEELRNVVTEFTSRNEFEDLFRLQTGGEDMFIRIQEKDGIIRDAILMMHSAETFFVIELRGNISMQHFTSLVESGNLQDLTDLADLDF